MTMKLELPYTPGDVYHVVASAPFKVACSECGHKKELDLISYEVILSRLVEVRILAIPTLSGKFSLVSFYYFQGLEKPIPESCIFSEGKAARKKAGQLKNAEHQNRRTRERKSKNGEVKKS